MSLSGIKDVGDISSDSNLINDRIIKSSGDKKIASSDIILDGNNNVTMTTLGILKTNHIQSITGNDNIIIDAVGNGIVSFPTTHKGGFQIISKDLSANWLPFVVTGTGSANSIVGGIWQESGEDRPMIGGHNAALNAWYNLYTQIGGGSFVIGNVTSATVGSNKLYVLGDTRTSGTMTCNTLTTNNITLTGTVTSITDLFRDISVSFDDFFSSGITEARYICLPSTTNQYITMVRFAYSMASFAGSNCVIALRNSAGTDIISTTITGDSAGVQLIELSTGWSFTEAITTLVITTTGNTGTLYVYSCMITMRK
jgi:hypothetical protein